MVYATLWSLIGHSKRLLIFSGDSLTPVAATPRVHIADGCLADKEGQR
jgi:hypothetical protein